MDLGRAASLAGALAILASACAPPDPPPLVVWIEVDTLRADALGCYGSTAVDAHGEGVSPGLDELAANAVRFERAYATAPWTLPSVVTQFTGLWPAEHGAQRITRPIDTDLDTLPERLREAGWRTAGVTTNFVTTSRVTPGFDQGFERWSEAFATGHEGSHAADALDQLGAWSEELLEEPGEGLFLFALLFEPHFRYEHHDDHPFLQARPEPYGGALTGAESLAELRARRAELDAADAEFLRDLYRSEVAAVDDAIRTFLSDLGDRGLAEQALVIVTADHGEELLDRGWIGHTITLQDELVRVPLIVKLPASARAGAVVDAPVSLLDLPATVLDHAGLATDLGRSRSLLPLIGGADAPRRWLLLQSDFEPPTPGGAEKRTLKWGVVDGLRRLKYVEDRLADTAHLYDLAADPGERVDLAGTGLAEEAELAAALRALEGGEEPE